MPCVPHLLRIPTKLRRRARRSRMATLLLLLLLVLLLLFPFYAVYKPPRLLIAYFAYRWPDVLWRVVLPSRSSSTTNADGAGARRKPVALTIDDAPSDHTPAILAELAAHGAHATFFVIGSQVPGREAVLRDIVRAGHELGNHGMHDEYARALSDDELARQIREVHSLIVETYRAVGRPLPGGGEGLEEEIEEEEEQVVDAEMEVQGRGRVQKNRLLQQKQQQQQQKQGKQEKHAGPSHPSHRAHPFYYYRPGSGFFSTRMRALVPQLGYRLVLGSIYPHDAQISSWWLNARHILSMLRPGGIIICHDRRSWTVPMLRRVLPEMKRRGYRAVTVTELLAEAAAES